MYKKSHSWGSHFSITLIPTRRRLTYTEWRSQLLVIVTTSFRRSYTDRSVKPKFFVKCYQYNVGSAFCNYMHVDLADQGMERPTLCESYHFRDSYFFSLYFLDS